MPSYEFNQLQFTLKKVLSYRNISTKTYWRQTAFTFLYIMLLDFLSSFKRPHKSIIGSPKPVFSTKTNLPLEENYEGKLDQCTEITSHILHLSLFRMLFVCQPTNLQFERRISVFQGTVFVYLTIIFKLDNTPDILNLEIFHH